MNIITNKKQILKIDTNTQPKRTIFLFAALFIVFISSVINLLISNDQFASQALTSGLLNVGLAVVTAVTTYVLASMTQGNFKASFIDKIDYLQCINIGLMIGLMLPFNVSIYAIIVSTVIAIYVSSLIYGGRHYSIFNVSVVAALFITLAFSISNLSIDTGEQVVMHTPLIEQLKLYIAGGNEFMFNTFNTFTGATIGLSMGSSQILTLLVIMVILMIYRIIDYRLSLSFLISSFVLTYFVANQVSLDFSYVLAHMMSGYLIFAAVFLVTSESTTPTTREGKIIFGFMVALFTISMRMLSVHTEGLLFAILLSNITVPLLNRTVKKSNTTALVKTLAGVIILLLFFGMVLGLIGVERFWFMTGGGM
jgi:electron transport complex protein RnfD